MRTDHAPPPCGPYPWRAQTESLPRSSLLGFNMDVLEGIRAAAVRLGANFDIRWVGATCHWVLARDVGCWHVAALQRSIVKRRPCTVNAICSSRTPPCLNPF